ncbi:preQ(1) synthase [Hyphococcus sp.]|jgi:7-cyano-7-deazaguanine reductase|uniref:preQ(1) synthase n=1 Tax=Hyphococcus sp. TaxID=2038636 RepID=UPI003D0F09F6
MAQKTNQKTASKRPAARKAATLETLDAIDRSKPAKSRVKAKGASLTQLGRQTAAPADPERATLETAPNPQAGELYVARFTAPEFTSLCPVTGQPDFAHLVIDYVPGKLIVESKSFKLFLTSFRNHGAFHEDCTVYIAKRLVAAAKPKWLRIAGYWYPRGGIPIDVFYQTGEPPKGVWLPEPGVAPYRGRG